MHRALPAPSLQPRADGPRGAPQSTWAGAGAPSARPRCAPRPRHGPRCAPARPAPRARPATPVPAGPRSPGSRLRAKGTPGRAGSGAVQFAPPRHAPGTAGRARRRPCPGAAGALPAGIGGRGRHTENAPLPAAAAVRTGLRLRNEKLPRLKTAGTAARDEPREEPARRWLGLRGAQLGSVQGHSLPARVSGHGLGKRAPVECWALHGVRGTRCGGDSSAESLVSVMSDCSPVQPTAPHPCRHLWAPPAPQHRSPLPLLFSDESTLYVCLGSCSAPAVTGCCSSLPYHVFVLIPGTINCSNICRDVLVLPE